MSGKDRGSVVGGGGGDGARVRLAGTYDLKSCLYLYLVAHAARVGMHGHVLDIWLLAFGVHSVTVRAVLCVPKAPGSMIGWAWDWH